MREYACTMYVLNRVSESVWARERQRMSERVRAWDREWMRKWEWESLTIKIYKDRQSHQPIDRLRQWRQKVIDREWVCSFVFCLQLFNKIITKINILSNKNVLLGLLFPRFFDNDPRTQGELARPGPRAQDFAKCYPCSNRTSSETRPEEKGLTPSHQLLDQSIV